MPSRIEISNPDFNVEAIMDTLRESIAGGQVTQGPLVARAESLMSDTFGANYASALTNGTASLRAALISSTAVKHGFDKKYIDREVMGGEVVIPAFSFNATLNVVLQAGMIARLTDINESDFCIDPITTKAAINNNTLAIMPVDLYGQAAGISSQTSEFKEIAVVRDSAQAHGATMNGQPIVDHGDAVSLSFYPTKNIAAPEGGAVLTNDREVDSVVRIYRNQGMVERYVYEMMGDNLRMTDIHAAFLIESLNNFKHITMRRRANAAAMIERLIDIPGLKTPIEMPQRGHVWHQFTVMIDPSEFGVDRNNLQSQLNEYGIGSGIYYPKNMAEHDTFRNHPRIINEPTPVADMVTKRVLSLPVHPGVTAENIEYIASTIRAIQRKGKKFYDQP